MKEIGQQLREAREKRKLSIQDVAVATKINTKIVKAIEEGDEDSLPAKPFLRGFVQTYARYLELNVDDVMKRFLEAHGSTKPKPVITEDGTSTAISHEEVQNKFEMYKKIAYVVAAIVAIVFIYFIQRVVSKYEQESKNAKEQKEAVKSQIVETPAVAPVEPNSTPADGTTPTPPADAAAAISPTTDAKPVDEKATEAKPADVKPEEKKAEEKKPEEKKPEEKKPEVKTEVKPTEPAKPVSAVPLVTAPPTPVKPVETKPTEVKPVEVKPIEVKKEEPKKEEPKKVEEKKPEEKKQEASTGKPQQVIIEALDNVEIRYSKDGESERTVKLKPEQFLTIKAGSKINLNVSDSGAVNIIHNGRDKGVPGNLGTPSKISYP